MSTSWAEVIGDADEALQGLLWGQFVIIDYDAARFGEAAPYAQAAVGPYGVYAEVASDVTIDFWRHDTDWLSVAGWSRSDSTDNWYRYEPGEHGLGRLLIDGLQYGRGCLLPELFTVRVGRFPSLPDGGEHHPQDLDLAA